MLWYLIGQKLLKGYAYLIYISCGVFIKPGEPLGYRGYGIFGPVLHKPTYRGGSNEYQKSMFWSLVLTLIECKTYQLQPDVRRGGGGDQLVYMRFLILALVQGVYGPFCPRWGSYGALTLSSAVLLCRSLF